MQRKLGSEFNWIFIGDMNSVDTAEPGLEATKNMYFLFPTQNTPNAKPSHFGPVILMAILRGEELQSKLSLPWVHSAISSKPESISQLQSSLEMAE